MKRSNESNCRAVQHDGRCFAHPTRYSRKSSRLASNKIHLMVPHCQYAANGIGQTNEIQFRAIERRLRGVEVGSNAKPRGWQKSNAASACPQLHPSRRGFFPRPSENLTLKFSNTESFGRCPQEIR